MHDTYVGEEATFWRLSRTINERAYSNSPYWHGIDFFESVELRAVHDPEGKFGTSQYHDFPLHHRINTMCRTLHRHCMTMIFMFKCAGPLPDHTSRQVRDHINEALQLTFEAHESLRERVQLQELLGMVVREATSREVRDRVGGEPESLCLVWLFALTMLYKAITQSVAVRFERPSVWSILRLQ